MNDENNMSLYGLIEKNLQFILFGGKGGVGKTTMAAASAIAFAKKHAKKKILIFTTDPAPSLADSLGQELSDELTKVKGFNNLWALEINAGEELKKFKKEYGDDILDILQQGTYLSDEETEDIFSLDIPGLDEVMGLKKITDFMDSSDYDVYFLDTAPTGHTLRLLTLPELLDDWIKFLANLRWKYHYMVDRLSRGKAKKTEKADEFLLDMKRTVKKVQGLLHDPEKTTFVVVSIAEAMGVAETKDLIRDLEKYKISSKHIIINNIVPNDKSTFLQRRRKVQEQYIKETRELFPSHMITEVELAEEEMRGVERLTSLGNQLYAR